MSTRPEPLASAAPHTRRAERHLTMLMVGKVRRGDTEFPCLVNDVSRHGLKARFPQPPRIGERLMFDLRGLPALAGTVRWIDGIRAGVEFDRPLDLGPILGFDQRGWLARAPRFRCDRAATLMLGGQVLPVAVRDLSLGGARLAVAGATAVVRGSWATLTLPGLAAPRAGTACWEADDGLGFRFATPLSLEALAGVLAG